MRKFGNFYSNLNFVVDNVFFPTKYIVYKVNIHLFAPNIIVYIILMHVNKQKVSYILVIDQHYTCKVPLIYVLSHISLRHKIYKYHQPKL